MYWSRLGVVRPTANLYSAYPVKHHSMGLQCFLTGSLLCYSGHCFVTEVVLLCYRGGIALLQGSLLCYRGGIALLQRSLLCYKGGIALLQGSLLCYRGGIALLQGSLLCYRGGIALLQRSVLCYRGGIALLQRSVLCSRSVNPGSHPSHRPFRSWTSRSKELKDCYWSCTSDLISVIES